MLYYKKNVLVFCPSAETRQKRVPAEGLFLRRIQKMIAYAPKFALASATTWGALYLSLETPLT